MSERRGGCEPVSERLRSVEVTCAGHLDAASLAGQRVTNHRIRVVASPAPDSPWLSWVALLAGTGAVVLELALAVGLWLPRARPWLMPLGLALHGVFYVMLPVSTFSAMVWCAYLAFLDRDRLHAFLDELPGHRSKRLAVIDR
ncbi:MAG: hypothetical protein GX607_20995 [Myxococcales bacterium]|nr:hypothetical protein [Myxococcales bacterium]